MPGGDLVATENPATEVGELALQLGQPLKIYLPQDSRTAQGASANAPAGRRGCARECDEILRRPPASDRCG